MGTAGILGGWALQGLSAVGHCRDTLRLGTAGILGGWSLKSASSRARTTSTLKSSNPTARVENNLLLSLQGYLVVGHCRDTWWLGTAGILSG